MSTCFFFFQDIYGVPLSVFPKKSNVWIVVLFVLVFIVSCVVEPTGSLTGRSFLTPPQFFHGQPKPFCKSLFPPPLPPTPIQIVLPFDQRPCQKRTLLVVNCFCDPLQRFLKPHENKHCSHLNWRQLQNTKARCRRSNGPFLTSPFKSAHSNSFAADLKTSTLGS